MRFLRSFALALLAALTIASLSMAQKTAGQIAGQATLEDGKPAEGVTVTATSAVLQGQRTAVTVSTGEYVLPGLPPGDYTIAFTLEGMNTVESKVTLPLGGTVRVEARMVPEAITETIEVRSEAAPLVTPSVGSNRDYKTIDQLAIGRTLAQIGTLTPGVTDNTQLPGQLSISGGFGYDNVFMVNGVD